MRNLMFLCGCCTDLSFGAAQFWCLYVTRGITRFLIRAAVRQEQAPSMYVVPPLPPPRHNIRSTPASQPLVRKEWPVPDGSSAAKDRMASACCAFQRPVGLSSSCTSRMRCARLAGLLRLFVVTYDAGLQTSSLPSSAFSSSDTSRKLQPVVVSLGNDERNK
nr:uncharacterized protein LOC127307734 [Lolium perenne]